MTTPYSILLLDDDLNLAHTLSLILNRAGFNVFATMDADELHNLFALTHTDLVILDLKWPDHSLIGEISRWAYPTHLLIFTGDSPLNANGSPLQNDQISYLIKPADPQTIVYEVRALLPEAE